MGRELDYEQLVPARSVEGDLEGTLRLARRWRVDFDLASEWYTPEGDETIWGMALRERIFWQFNPVLGVRVIGSTTLGDVDDPTLDTSYLLTWLRHPGTEAYIGATHLFTLGPTPSLVEQVLFAKLSWLFRA